MTYEQDLLQRVCKGQPEAADWLARAIVFFHAADDFIDELTTTECKIRLLVQAQELYFHPFFLRNGNALHAVMRTCINMYADSEQWKGSQDELKSNWSEVLRHAGVELVLAVADIVGGWDHRRLISQEYRTYDLNVASNEQQRKD